jgi:hypothetical protein
MTTVDWLGCNKEGVAMGGLALIGAILCFLWLAFGADAGLKARRRKANKAYKEDMETHNYNLDLQFDIRNGKIKPPYRFCYGLWELVRTYKLSSDIANDVYMAKMLKDNGYDFNPRHAHFDPLRGTDGYKDVELGTRLFEEYRQKVCKLLDEYMENPDQEMEKAIKAKHESKVISNLHGLKITETKLFRYK